MALARLLDCRPASAAPGQSLYPPPAELRSGDDAPVRGACVTRDACAWGGEESSVRAGSNASGLNGQACEQQWGAAATDSLMSLAPHERAELSLGPRASGVGLEIGQCRCMHAASMRAACWMRAPERCAVAVHHCQAQANQAVGAAALQGVRTTTARTSNLAAESRRADRAVHQCTCASEVACCLLAAGTHSGPAACMPRRARADGRMGWQNRIPGTGSRQLAAQRPAASRRLCPCRRRVLSVGCGCLDGRSGATRRGMSVRLYVAEHHGIVHGGRERERHDPGLRSQGPRVRSREPGAGSQERVHSTSGGALACARGTHGSG